MKRRAVVAVIGLAVGLSGCLSPEQSARLMIMGQAMQGAGAAMRGTQASYAPPAPGAGSYPPSEPGAGGICTLGAARMSGLYRNCVYTCGAAGVITRTVGAADLCPTSID
jgi:hypothetical protein